MQQHTDSPDNQAREETSGTQHAYRSFATIGGNPLNSTNSRSHGHLHARQTQT